MIRRARRDGKEARGNGDRERIEKETKRQFEKKEGLRDPPPPPPNFFKRIF